jgi:DNA topoisomerase-6 subunit B
MAVGRAHLKGAGKSKRKKKRPAKPGPRGARAARGGAGRARRPGRPKARPAGTARSASKAPAKRADPAQTVLKLVEGGAAAGAVPGTDAEPRGGAARRVRATDAPPEHARPSAPASRRGPAVTAVQLGAKQRAISVSEFFTKNRHLLGFDNPAKALLTAVKEAVDNSLDACEESGIPPDLVVRVNQLAEDRFRVVVQDNGPGIVRAQIPKIFGSLLYGSKFHTLKQARGQQGLGISAAGMYGQLTTGKPMDITSRIGPRRPAHHYEIQIDTKRNAPSVMREDEVEWDAPHGTRVEIELEATYKKGKHSVDGYLEGTALANPHASIVYYPPKENPIRFERVTDELPKQPLAIKPHPHGVEFGILVRMLRESKARNLRSFLQGEFSRVSAKVAEEICEAARVRATAKPARLGGRDAEALYKAIGGVKIMNPPTNCLSPIGQDLIVQGLKSQVDAEFYTAVTRGPSVYRGNPFLIEAGVAYGGKDLPQDELVNVLRYANRVPLLYQQGACAITKGVVQTSWKTYGLAQSRGALPSGPAVVMIHIASAWVPFTSESKEAIAHYPEIVKEIKLAIQECGRKLGAHIRRRTRQAEAEKKISYIEKYIPHIGAALKDILGLSERQERKVVETLRGTLERSRKP